jgi:2-phosphosulfolactate phosphatase
MTTTAVSFLPSDFQPEDVQGSNVVIVDILRASTTITHALAAGAALIRPCLTIDEARNVQQQDASSNRDDDSAANWLLGGERKGVLIDGFDFGNSPTAYTAERVSNRRIAFTTTNGTKALLRCRQAEQILIGCFANLSAVADQLAASSRPAHIVCAGTDGNVTGEDVLFAGALVDRLAERSDRTPTDAARVAASFWRQSRAASSVEARIQQLRESQGGRNLIALGYDADIACAAQIDSCPVVGHVSADGCIYALPAETETRASGRL